MKIIIGLIVVIAGMSCLAEEKGQPLDKQAVGLLVAQSEVVVRCRMETSAVSRMDPAMARRYGLVITESRLRATVGEALVGPAIVGEKITFYGSLVNGEQRSVAEGEYVLFLRRDAQKRWILANDLQGVQPYTEGLKRLVLEVHGK